MRKDNPVSLTLLHPRTEKGKQELARRVAGIHAEDVLHRLSTMNCPADQKTAILGKVIRIIEQNRERN